MGTDSLGVLAKGPTPLVERFCDPDPKAVAVFLVVAEAGSQIGLDLLILLPEEGLHSRVANALIKVS